MTNDKGTLKIKKEFLYPMMLSAKHELFCWLAGSYLAMELFSRSHTASVTTETFYYGVALFGIVVFLFWLKLRQRTTPEPRWLKITASLILVILSVVFLIYLLGVAAYYE